MDAGCGNSYLLEDMAMEGYENLVGADISRVVIEQMRSRSSKFPEITFFRGNMIDTDLPERSFDAIIDKGLFDSFICNHLGVSEVEAYVREVCVRYDQ